ncbi:MAG: fibrobacter succinogenes major paralogous domain-containing protein, partial [Dysgonamonadaceae bacterium]|jgi:hypothetical protein|nr:fibrobacter succinogenes major paralogous domain-containing protein [Dysgonamonadaceae bacterium]
MQDSIYGGTNEAPSTGTPIYVHTDDGWIQTNVATASRLGLGGFTANASNTERGATAWKRIPCINTYGENMTTYSDFRDNKGDICKLINPAYRMPLGTELNHGGATNAYDWESAKNQWHLNCDTWGSVIVSMLTADGKYKIAWGGEVFGVAFPASGYRSGDFGSIDNAGTLGYYWSGSGNGGTSARHLTFLQTQVNPVANAVPVFGYSVRCVKDI